MAKYVAHDRIGLIFPEGTRKNKDEEGRKKFQNRFKLGTVSIAQKTGSAILPVAINSFGKDTIVRFSEPFFVGPTDDLVEVNKQLELLIADLSIENMRYYYSEKNQYEELKKEEEKYDKYIKEVLKIDENQIIKKNIIENTGDNYEDRNKFRSVS